LYKYLGYPGMGGRLWVSDQLHPQYRRGYDASAQPLWPSQPPGKPVRNSFAPIRGFQGGAKFIQEPPIVYTIITNK